jgi:hypothetical protein
LVAERPEHLTAAKVKNRRFERYGFHAGVAGLRHAVYAFSQNYEQKSGGSAMSGWENFSYYFIESTMRKASASIERV